MQRGTGRSHSPFDQRAEDGCCQTRMRHAGVGESGAELTIYIRDAVLFGNARQITGPFQLARRLDFVEDSGGILKERPHAGVIDDEIDVRPILGHLGDIPIGVVL